MYARKDLLKAMKRISSFLLGSLVAALLAAQECPSWSAPADAWPQPPVLHSLGHRLRIEMAADSWTNLCAMAKPTFTWKGRDLIWVETNASGNPVMRLNCAYLYGPTSGKLQWVLLDTQEGAWDESYAQVMGDNLKGLARLQSSKPTSDHGSGDYAIALAESDQHGTVYEVGWQKLMANGTSLAAVERRFYLLKDREGRWTLLGEGPEESRGKSGSRRASSTASTPRVEWIDSIRIPCHIAFAVVEQNDEWAGCDDPPRTLRRTLVLHEDLVLDGTTKELRPLTPRPYVRVAPGDNLTALVEHLASWIPGWESVSKEKLQRIHGVWREGLLRLNTGMDFEHLIPGSKIEVLTYAEIMKWLR